MRLGLSRFLVAVCLFLGGRLGANTVVLLVDSSEQGPQAQRMEFRQSAAAALDGLSDDDRVAIVAYADRAKTLVPLMRLAGNRERLAKIISNLPQKGESGLFTGLSRAGEELRRAPAHGKNRKILMVFGPEWGTTGPHLPNEIDRIVRSFLKEGFSVHGLSCPSLGKGKAFHPEFPQPPPPGLFPPPMYPPEIKR